MEPEGRGRTPRRAIILAVESKRQLLSASPWQSPTWKRSRRRSQKGCELWSRQLASSRFPHWLLRYLWELERRERTRRVKPKRTGREPDISRRERTGRSQKGGGGTRGERTGRRSCFRVLAVHQTPEVDGRQQERFTCGAMTMR